MNTETGLDFIVSENEFNLLKNESVLKTCQLLASERQYEYDLYLIAGLLKKRAKDSVILYSELGRLFYLMSWDLVYTANYSAPYPWMNNERKKISTDTLRGVLGKSENFINHLTPYESSLLSVIYNYYSGVSHQNGENWAYLKSSIRFLCATRKFTLDKAGIFYENNSVVLKSYKTDEKMFSKEFIDSMSSLIKEVFSNAEVRSIYENCLENSVADNKRYYSVTNNALISSGGIQDDFDLGVKSYRELLDSSFTKADGVVILDPLYFECGVLRSEVKKVDFIISENKEAKMVKILNGSRRALKKRNITILDSKILDSTDISDYELLSQMNKWYKDFSFSNGRECNVDEYGKRYLIDSTKASYALEVLFVSQRHPRHPLTYMGLLGPFFFVPILWPDVFLKIVRSRAKTIMLVRLFDVKRNKLVLTESHYYKSSKLKPSVMAGLVYDAAIRSLNGKIKKK